jgi:hypothetical protein
MIVWQDTHRRRMVTPPWLQGAHVHRVHHEGGDLLAVGGAAVAACLGWREGHEWVDVGDGWSATLYDNDPRSADLLRQQHWAMTISVLDARGRPWLVPAILSPDGFPAVAQTRRLTADGWVREPATDLARAAVDACQAARARLDDLGAVDLDTQGSWIGAVLEAVYHTNALTVAKLGLVDDVLVRHGLRMACGRMDRGEGG